MKNVLQFLHHGRASLQDSRGYQGFLVVLQEASLLNVKKCILLTVK